MKADGLLNRNFLLGAEGDAINAILAIGISGIQQFGASFFVEPLFNGVTLLVAIGIAGYAQRRRGAGSARAPASPAQGSSTRSTTTTKGD